jgi:tetratricopeptide (TPR) repeat protein
MTWRYRGTFALVLVTVLAAAGCATTPTAVGSQALRAGRPADAVEQFEKALAEEPGRIDALTGLGIAKYRLGTYDEAIAALGDAVAQAPEQAAARLYLALAHVRKRDDAKAQEHLTLLRGMPLDPRFAALVDQALVLLRTGPLNDAGRTYLIASLDYAAEWSRELAETRRALNQAQLAWDPFWTRPVYVIRCRNC